MQRIGLAVSPMNVLQVWLMKVVRYGVPDLNVKHTTLSRKPTSQLTLRLAVVHHAHIRFIIPGNYSCLTASCMLLSFFFNAMKKKIFSLVICLVASIASVIVFKTFAGWNKQYGNGFIRKLPSHKIVGR